MSRDGNVVHNYCEDMIIVSTVYLMKTVIKCTVQNNYFTLLGHDDQPVSNLVSIYW